MILLQCGYQMLGYNYEESYEKDEGGFVLRLR